jgi:DNA-binding FadR family transcriptional regulator
MQNKTISALELLKKNLHSGHYQLGERLPSERALCEKLGLSRSGLRKVLSHLEAEDLIWRHVGRGTFAGPRPALSTETFNIVTQKTNPLEIMEARLMLEPQIAAAAARSASFQEIERLALCAKRNDEAKDLETNEKWDVLFHETLVIATSNSLIISLYSGISKMRLSEEWYLKKQEWITPETWVSFKEEHAAIVKAVRERNETKAEEAMFNHLLSVRTHIQSTYPETRPMLGSL